MMVYTCSETFKNKKSNKQIYLLIGLFYWRYGRDFIYKSEYINNTYYNTDYLRVD